MATMASGTALEAEDWAWMRLVLLAASTWLLARILDTAQLIARSCEEVVAPGSGSGPIAEGVVAVQVEAGLSFPRGKAGGPATHTWHDYSASCFSVRTGPNYPRYGLKASSGPAFGQVVAMDTFRASRKMHHIMGHGLIQLPKPTPGWSEPYAEFVVVVQMLPMVLRHTLLTSEATDGETFHLISYVRLRPGLAPGWRGDRDPSGPEELLKRFLLRADQDETIALAFKEIGMLANLEEVGALLPSPIMKLLRRFNGKPVLTRPEHKFYRGIGNAYLEISLDGHRYSYATRAAIHSVTRSLGQIELAYGMVVEARSEAQMPERMLFSCKVAKLDMSRVVEYPPRPTPGKGHQDAPEGAGRNPRGGEARNGGSEGEKVGGYRSGAWWLRGCLGWSE